VSADELRPATILFNPQVLFGFGLALRLIGLIRGHSTTCVFSGERLWPVPGLPAASGTGCAGNHCSSTVASLIRSQHYEAAAGPSLPGSGDSRSLLGSSEPLLVGM
jgi:hypothetical protein